MKSCDKCNYCEYTKITTHRYRCKNGHGFFDLPTFKAFFCKDYMPEWKLLGMTKAEYKKHLKDRKRYLMNRDSYIKDNDNKS